jgi:hypothetical protein
VKTRPIILLLPLLVLLCGQGCLVYRYTTTPLVSGTVIDSASKQPIAGAKVGFRKHDKKTSMTASDGSFHSQPDHVWRPCLLMPEEFTPCGGVFFVEASDYKAFERMIGPRQLYPFTFLQPIELEKATQ